MAHVPSIVDPGAVSGHVHTIAGGSGFAQSVTYESMRSSRCTTAPVTEDKSNYWIPQLYHYDPSDKSYTMVPVNYMNAYYLPRPGNKDKKVYAFPDGLRMLSGEPARRDFSSSDPNDKAITYVCLEFSGAHRGNPEWDQRNSFFRHNECPQGIRAQVNFPNCWDGVNLDSADHRSHMAWPSGGVDGGDCPASHPVHLVSLFYEFIFQTQDFAYNNGSQPTWVWANGDTTGYGLHADFINGWPSLVNGTNILQRAIDECNINNGVGGNLQDCPPLAPFLDNRAAYACQPENPIVNEDIGDRGKIFSLPGNNPLYTGPGMVTGNGTSTDPEPGLVNTTSPLPSGWTRSGCIGEAPNAGRALSAASMTSDNMTRGGCVSFCASKGLPLAGVEYGRECYCDSQLRNGATNQTLLPDSNCGSQCSGNTYENCGGGRTLDLFVNPSLFQAGPVLPSGWAAAGCRTEATSGRALSGYSFSSSNMTNELCVSTCASRGFTIAGTEYSRECYCGNSYNTGSTPATAATQCNMACAGNAGQTCGGGSRLSVFTGPSGSGTSSSSSSSSTSASSSSSSSASRSSSTSSSSSSSVSSSTASTTTTTSSTAATTSPSPAAAPLPSGWTANGCYVEASPRALGGYSFTSSNMTTELCLNTCYSRGFLYAGTEYASECYCGNELTAAVATDSTCNMACKGNANQTCGGPSRLTTYKSNIQATAAGVPSGWSALGCLTDSGSARTFDGYRFSSDSMNYTLCTSTCASRGFNFAGIQYGRECYCGNTQGGSTAATSDCSMSCAGDMYSKCGGSWRLTAFKSNTNNTAPATTSSTATASSTSTTAAAVASVAAPSGWSAMGCWTDQGNPRSLNGYKYSSSSAMTYDSCTSACAQRGFTYAGIEYGGECFCDNTLAGSSAPAGDCNMMCNGDKTQPCGGSWRMNVFKAQPATVTTSSTTSSSATTSTTPSSATTSTASSSAAASPTGTILPDGWSNVGCNTDKPSNRVISGLRLTANNMTWTSCISQCASRGYWYAGVEYSSECYCGFAATLSAADQSSCNMKCAGDSSINCGGADRIQVFYNADAEAKAKANSASLPGNWKTYGCIVDSASMRVVTPYYRQTSQQMTYNLCASTCQANGYAYAGVEYGSECYCGNNVAIQDASSGCNMPCSGDPSSMCGGSARMNLMYNADSVTPPTRPTRRSLVRGGVRLDI